YDSSGGHYQGSGVQSVSMSYDALGSAVLQVVNSSSAWYQYDTSGAHYQGSGVQSVSAAVDRFGVQTLQVVIAKGASDPNRRAGRILVEQIGGRPRVRPAGSTQSLWGVLCGRGPCYQYEAGGAHHQGG